MLINVLQCTRQAPTIENYPAQEVNSAEVEKLYCKEREERFRKCCNTPFARRIWKTSWHSHTWHALSLFQNQLTFNFSGNHTLPTPPEDESHIHLFGSSIIISDSECVWVLIAGLMWKTEFLLSRNHLETPSTKQNHCNRRRKARLFCESEEYNSRLPCQ